MQMEQLMFEGSRPARTRLDFLFFILQKRTLEKSVCSGWKVLRGKKKVVRCEGGGRRGRGGKNGRGFERMQKLLKWGVKWVGRGRVVAGQLTTG